MDLAQLLVSRPYLYHLTATTNLFAISACRVLRPAADLLRQSGQPNAIRAHRRTSLRLVADGLYFTLRDQAPLYEGNVELTGGWTFSLFLESLNSRVFFWPGQSTGPIDYGLRHFERYRRESPTILRAPLADVLRENPANSPLLCRFNSGSPRCSGGRKSPRGPDTFLKAPDYTGTAASVVEVTFLRAVSLPSSTQLSNSPTGPWRPLGTQPAA